MCGLRHAKIQPAASTPRAVWNPDIDDANDYRSAWIRVSDKEVFDNAFKVQWELFLRHVALGEPFRWTLREAAKGVQLAELGIESWRKRCWVEVPQL